MPGQITNSSSCVFFQEINGSCKLPDPIGKGRANSIPYTSVSIYIHVDNLSRLPSG